MRLDLSVLGWIHTVLCIIALVLGGLNLARPKGTKSHRQIGQWYLVSLVALSATSLGIYRLHRFFFPHWFAIAAIILACLAFAFARFRWPRQLWLHGHTSSTVLSYYVLIAGGVNEAYLRIDVLNRLAGGFPSPIIGRTHFALMLLTVLALIWFNMNVRRRRFPGASARSST